MKGEFNDRECFVDQWVILVVKAWNKTVTSNVWSEQPPKDDTVFEYIFTLLYCTGGALANYSQSKCIIWSSV